MKLTLKFTILALFVLLVFLIAGIQDADAFWGYGKNKPSNPKCSGSRGDSLEQCGGKWYCFDKNEPNQKYNQCCKADRVKSCSWKPPPPRKISTPASPSPTNPPVVKSSGGGSEGSFPSPGSGSFKVNYFNSVNFRNYRSPTKTENRIGIGPHDNFRKVENWGGGKPSPIRSNDKFSMKYSGRFKFDDADYTFFTFSDDGSRLWIDGGLIINNWGNHGYRGKTSKIRMGEGTHTIQVAYFENTGGAHLEFGWDVDLSTKKVVAPPPPPPPDTSAQRFTKSGSHGSSLRIQCASNKVITSTRGSISCLGRGGNPPKICDLSKYIGKDQVRGIFRFNWVNGVCYGTGDQAGVDPCPGVRKVANLEAVCGPPANQPQPKVAVTLLAPETCFDGIDNNDDGNIDEGCSPGCADVTGDNKVNFQDFFHLADCAGLTAPTGPNGLCPVDKFNKFDWDNNDKVDASSRSRTCLDVIGCEDLNDDGKQDLTDFFIFADCINYGTTVKSCTQTAFNKIDLDGNGRLTGKETTLFTNVENVMEGFDGKCFLQQMLSNTNKQCGTPQTPHQNWQTCKVKTLGESCQDDSECVDARAYCSFGKKGEFKGKSDSRTRGQKDTTLTGACCTTGQFFDGNECTKQGLESCSCGKSPFDSAFYDDPNCLDPKEHWSCVKTTLFGDLKIYFIESRQRLFRILFSINPQKEDC